LAQTANLEWLILVHDSFDVQIHDLRSSS
jgi:hypothetical protein